MPGKSQRNTHCGKTQRLRRTRASQRPSGSSDLLSSQQLRTGSALRVLRSDRLAAAHGVHIGDRCALNMLPSFDRREQQRHRKDRGARGFDPARADKMCRRNMYMIREDRLINISSSTSVIMSPFLYTRRCRESRAERCNMATQHGYSIGTRRRQEGPTILKY